MAKGKDNVPPPIIVDRRTRAEDNTEDDLLSWSWCGMRMSMLALRYARGKLLAAGGVAIFLFG
jgi:hypothetical protein